MQAQESFEPPLGRVVSVVRGSKEDRPTMASTLSAFIRKIAQRQIVDGTSAGRMAAEQALDSASQKEVVFGFRL